MRSYAFPVSTTCLRISLASALLAISSAGFGQSGSLEERVRALEAKVAALEGRAAPASSTAAVAATGPTCHRLAINGYSLSPTAKLTVTVNGAEVANYDGSSAHDNLEPFMRPGPNTIGVAFAAPGDSYTAAELACLASPSAVSRNTILKFKPGPGRLSEQAVVVLPPG